VVRNQIDKAVSVIDNSEISVQESVHRVRKCCKNIRALLCLIEPSLAKHFKQENFWYKDTTAALSNLRDADAMLESLDKLLIAQSDNSNVEGIDEVAASWLQQQLLVRKNDVASAREDTDHALNAAKVRLQKGRQRLAIWRIKDKGFETISSGLEKTYRQARSRMKTAKKDPSNKNLHDWRKRIKQLYFHIYLLTKSWPALLTCLGDELKRLGEILGDDHDLAVLTEFVRTTESGHCKEVILGAIGAQRTSLQATAIAMGERLCAESPKNFRKRHQLYWEASQRQGNICKA